MAEYGINKIKTVTFMITDICSLRFNTGLHNLAVEEVGGHEELEGDLWRDRELGDLGGAVGETDLVGEVHAHLLKDVGRNLTEVHLIGFVFRKLPWSRQHRLDCARSESILALDNELVAIT